MADEGYLAGAWVGSPAFTKTDGIPHQLRPLWRMLADGQSREALAESRRLRRDSAVLPADVTAALLAASAASELRTGAPAEAIELAKQSLSSVEHQWMSHALRIAAYGAMQNPERAFQYALSIQLESPLPSWDEPIEAADLQVLRASLAWKVDAWDDVATYLGRAYPAGVASMPADLQEDWFRLAFYRNEPGEAAAAARSICRSRSVEQLDTLLNAMVQHGWATQALPLYREAFNRHSASQLLRRRLVGLCIRSGEVEEARRLTSAGALNIIA